MLNIIRSLLNDPNSRYDPQFISKPNFSYMKKPNPVQFINKINNEFVKKCLYEISDIIKQSHANKFYPLYYVADHWKKEYSSDLTDEIIIKDILKNIYDELFPIWFKLNGYMNPKIDFYDIEINSRNYFGGLFDLNNPVLVRIYLDWIVEKINEIKNNKNDLPIRLTISTREEAPLSDEMKIIISERFKNYPLMDEKLDNPFDKGNQMYIRDPNKFFGIIQEPNY